MRKINILSFVLFLNLFLLLPVFSVGSPIGTECDYDFECETNQCENSDNGIAYCVCKEFDFSVGTLGGSSESCANQYESLDSDPENWICTDGADATWDLNYCAYKKDSKQNQYPIPPGEVSTLDKILDSGAAYDILYENEIENIAKRKPLLQIKIPGLQSFSEAKTVQEDSGTYILIPFLSEYLAALYRYGVIIASIIATVMIINNGLKWTISGGSPEKIKDAQTRIMQSIVGILLAVGSYALLYNINPELVQFKNLRIPYVIEIPLGGVGATLDYSEIPGVLSTQVKAILASIPKPTWTAETFDCDNPPPAMGVIPESQVETFTCPVGVSGEFTVIPLMKNAVCKVGQMANSQGYAIKIYSSYRPFDKQVKIWCDEIKKGTDPKKLRNIVALPGFSNHGHGVAIDIALMKKGQTVSLTGGTSSSEQCSISENYIKALAEIFYQADGSFVRYEKEIWHFEYGTKGTSLRDWYNSFPEKCTGTKGTISTNIAEPQSGSSPAAASNNCTFTESRYNTKTKKIEIFRQETNTPYDKIIASDPNYVSKIDPRCSICEQDQEKIAVGGKSTQICWAYVEQVKSILNQAVSSGLEIDSLIGYRPLRAGGAIDDEGFRTGVGGHIYGMAIDTNAKYNGLYNNCKNWDVINDPKGPIPAECILKTKSFPWDPNINSTKSIYYGSTLYNAFTAAGWKWGGKDLGDGSQRDLMDFSKYGYDFSTK